MEKAKDKVESQNKVTGEKSGLSGESGITVGKEIEGETTRRYIEGIDEYIESVCVDK